MSLPRASERPRPRLRLRNRAISTDAISSLLTLALLTAITLYTALPRALPDPVPATAPPTVFSSGRALEHVRAIAKEPPPMGSPANAAVRDYLLGELAQLGLRPEVQRATVVFHGPDGLVAGAPENLLARLEGTANGKALLISADYDSVPTGLGASDDGAGVATMLEPLGALLWWLLAAVVTSVCFAPAPVAPERRKPASTGFARDRSSKATVEPADRVPQAEGVLRGAWLPGIVEGGLEDDMTPLGRTSTDTDPVHGGYGRSEWARQSARES